MCCCGPTSVLITEACMTPDAGHKHDISACMQVLDARDPLRYRSEDLEAFAREANPAKASLMLLNKADLLPQKLRAAWAAYFQEQGVDFIFWSAKAASEQTGAHHQA